MMADIEFLFIPVAALPFDGGAIGSVAIVVLVVAGTMFALWCAKSGRKLWREIVFERARELFTLQRERLEAKFVELAAATGKPRGLLWDSCDFHSPVSFVREKGTGRLIAFVEMTVQFAPVEDGPMEDVEAVHERRYATAVFHYQNGQWGTGGRVLFNMNPKEAIDHFQTQYEAVTNGP